MTAEADADARPGPTVRDLVNRLLADDPALAASLTRLDLSPDRLTEAATEHADEIWIAATPEAAALVAAQDQLRIQSGRQQQARLYPVPLASRLMVPWVVLGSVLAAVAYGLSFIRPWGARVSHDVSRAEQIVALALAVLTMAFVVSRLAAERLNGRATARTQLYNLSLGLEALAAKVTVAQSALTHALVERGLRPLVLRERAARATPVYTTELQYVSARGLSEVYNAAMFEVDTTGFQQIRSFLDSTPGGSFGLAGPRGTGKSTVLASFVEGRSRRSDNQFGVAVLVSAPVEYDPRDFILHLFAELCLKVYTPARRSPGVYDDGARERLSHRARLYSARWCYALTAVLAGTGALLILGAEDRLHVNVRLWAGVGLLCLTPFAAYLVLLSARSEMRRFRGQGQQAEEQWRVGRGAGSGARVSSETIDLARENLGIIRFQQTYTRGWSGSLTATAGPLAAQAGLTGGASFQANVLTLPDIVDLFREFVQAVAAFGPVIIGIDELDKIHGADRAQAFLNDIKSVFGIDNCYFLIAISEDALSNFERRGLPIRDAFDSALDDVARLGPLSYRTARELVRGRVVGLSEPYVAVAYCLSGGLPRDMIRWTRAVVHGHDKGTALAAICAPVVAEDMKRKLLATIVALAEDPSAEAQAAMRYLGALSATPEPGWLLETCADNLRPASATGGVNGNGGSALARWLTTIVPAARVAPPTDPPSPARKALVDLFGYFYFCATVLEVFGDALTEAAFSELAAGQAVGTFGQLARARQLFATDSWLAIAEIAAFRSARGLGHPLPGPAPYAPDRADVSGLASAPG